MDAWAESLGVPDNSPDNFFVFAGDPESSITTHFNLLLTHPGPTQAKGLWHRGKRAAVYIESGVVRVARVAQAEDDPAGDDRPDTTLAPAMIAAINEYEAEIRAKGHEDL